MSTFAATTCSWAAPSATLRENFVRRGNTAWIVPAPSSGRAAMATQSPTAGRSPIPGLVGEPAGGLGAKLAELGEDDVGAAVLLATRPENDRRGVGLEIGRMAVSQPRSCMRASESP